MRLMKKLSMKHNKSRNLQSKLETETLNGKEEAKINQTIKDLENSKKYIPLVYFLFIVNIKRKMRGSKNLTL